MLTSGCNVRSKAKEHLRVSACMRDVRFLSQVLLMYTPNSLKLDVLVIERGIYGGFSLGKF